MLARTHECEVLSATNVNMFIKSIGPRVRETWVHMLPLLFYQLCDPEHLSTFLSLWVCFFFSNHKMRAIIIMSMSFSFMG